MTLSTSIFLAWRNLTPLPIQVFATSANRFGIEGWPCLDGSLDDSGIDIYAIRNAECWDIIFNSDIALARFDAGWGCQHCIDAWKQGLYPKPEVYPSPEDLWIDHTLRPFGEWLEKLAGSAGIVFIDYDGATEAKLLQPGEEIPRLAVEVTRVNRGNNR